jgi:hypothetical protein
MGIHKYGLPLSQGLDMKTTVEIPDDLYRKAKATAALRGLKLKDLIEDGLRLALKRLGNTPSPEELRAGLKAVSGIVASGIPDLATNPEHLIGFGRDGSRHR